MRTAPNYLYRLTTLFGISEMSQVCSISMIKNNFLPALKEMSQDKIPNIRINVAKAALKIRETIYSPEGQASAGTFGPAVDAEIGQLLDDLSQDTDDDVKYFSRKAAMMKK